MTDIDIVAELRRLYEAVPQGKWTLEPYAGFTSGAMGYDIRIGPNAGDVIVGTGRALLDYDEREIGNLIVAMHNHLPALLDAIDTLRWYADAGNYHELICGGGGQRARAALAALKRSDEG